MPIIVNSPYSGLPVKVRDQDVSRAIRDEEGRVFYAVPRSDASGYYGSPTRQGSPRDEQRADEMASKIQQSKTSGTEQTQRQLHDATGRRRGGLRRLLVWLILLGAVLFGVWYFFFHTPQGASMRQQLPAMPGDTSSRLDEITPQTSESILHHPSPLPRPWITTATGLRYRIDQTGHAAQAAAGRFVRLHYTLTRPDDDAPLETTDNRGPVGFVLWSGQAIRAWDEAIAGMLEGEVRSVIVPQDQLDGDWPGRTLTQLPAGPLQFEIALLEVLAGVTHEVLAPGEGRLVLPGDEVEMQYVAAIAGADHPYDSTYARHHPLRFRVGRGQLIPGWELGVTGMREGEKRRLIIPPHLAYGGRGAGRLIPPDATLHVEVELLRIVDPRETGDALSRATLPRAGS